MFFWKSLAFSVFQWMLAIWSLVPLPWSKQVKSLSHVWLFAISWTVAYQALLFMGFFQAILLEWIAISFSSGSSQPRDQTWVSHIVDRCFTIWATREVFLEEWRAKVRLSVRRQYLSQRLVEKFRWGDTCKHSAIHKFILLIKLNTRRCTVHFCPFNVCSFYDFVNFCQQTSWFATRGQYSVEIEIFTKRPQNTNKQKTQTKKSP